MYPPSNSSSHDTSTDNQQSLLSIALGYLEHGFSVIPINPKDKRPLMAWERYQNTRATVDEIRQWFEQWPGLNIGIVTGAVSGVVVIDLDTPDAKEVVERIIPDVFSEVPRVRTGKGSQLYFGHPGFALPNKVGVIPGVDVRADGGYVVAPNSVHPNGKTYVWEIPLTDTLPRLPVRLLELVFPPSAELSASSRFDTARALRGVPEGVRDQTLFKFACKLRRADVPKEAACDLVLNAARECAPPFDEQEALKKVERAYSRYQPEYSYNSVTWKVVSYTKGKLGVKATVGMFVGGQIVFQDEVKLWKANDRELFVSRCKKELENYPDLDDLPNAERDLLSWLNAQNTELASRRKATREQLQPPEEMARAVATPSQVELIDDVDLLTVHAAQQELTSSPHSGDLLEIAMAAAVSLKLLEEDGIPVWVLAVGNPSSDKTKTILGIAQAPEVYSLDTMTENSFITGFVDPGGSKPVDLLAELIGKCLVIKDLTTLFSLKDDTIKRVRGDLQSVYDGNFARFTGTRGKVEYKTRLSLIGCVTPHALARHSRYISEMGSRLLFYRIPPLTDQERGEGLKLVWDDSKKSERVSKYRLLASSYVHKLICTSGYEITIPDEYRRKIDVLALLLARGRGVIRTSKVQFENEEGKTREYYEIDDTQVEEPFRATLQLKTLALALALIHGRTTVGDHELELLRRVVLSTMQNDRSSVLALFGNPSRITSEGTLTYRLCAQGLDKSYGRAKQLLTELTHLKILERLEGSELHFRPRPEFVEIIKVGWAPIDHILDLEQLSTTGEGEEGSDGNATLTPMSLHETPPRQKSFFNSTYQLT